MHGDRVVLAARLMQLAAKLGGMVLCDEETHDATRDDIRFVRRTPSPSPHLHAHPDRTLTRAAHYPEPHTRPYSGPNPNPNPKRPNPTPELVQVRLRPVNIKGKAGPYQPYRPVASSEILEKPTLRHLPEREYHQVGGRGGGG